MDENTMDTYKFADELEDFASKMVTKKHNSEDLVKKYQELPDKFKAYFPATHPDLAILIKISSQLGQLKNLKKITRKMLSPLITVRHSFVFETFKATYEEEFCSICMCTFAQSGKKKNHQEKSHRFDKDGCLIG